MMDNILFHLRFFIDIAYVMFTAGFFFWCGGWVFNKIIGRR